jgi:hypothetical protein
METDERPDLFDVKYLRDELLYYSRDENRFLRRRRTFVFALFPDLVQARFKDEGQPWQRIVLVLALLVAAVRKLTEWLSNDALVFELCFVGDGDAPALADERRLLEVLLREPLELGTTRLTRAENASPVEVRCSEYARRSFCHCLTVSTEDRPIQPEEAGVTRLIVGKEPEVRGIEGVSDWQGCLAELLKSWI